MKKVYNYNTGRLTESYELDKPSVKKVSLSSHLNESALDDVLDGRELCNPAELASAISSAIKSMDRAQETFPVCFWSQRGNAVAEDVEEACEKLGLSYETVNAREYDSYEFNNEDVLILDEYTLFNPIDAIEELESLAEEYSVIICLCSLDSRNAEMHATKLANAGAMSYLYTPRVEHMTRGVDPEYDDDDSAYESVTERFAKYRKLYEAEEEKPEEDPFANMFADDKGGDSEPAADEPEDKEKEGSEDSEDKGEDSEGGEDDEYVPMTAVILTVAKDDADKCKDEMVEAGIPEDGIEILEDEDEDEENAKIRVDADYAKELKDYLAGKGIDLEEKIGGEIVDDTEEEEDKEDKEEDSDKKDEEGEEGGEGNGEDFDFGDLFGDDEGSSDEEK